jgi:hypothetical protein
MKSNQKSYMKSSHMNLPNPRRSFARMSFTISSCVAAAAIALASPLFAAQREAALQDQAVLNAGGKADGISETRVQVMIEMNTAPAVVTFAAELKVAQAEAAAKQASVAGAKPPLLAAADANKLPRVEISSAATARVQNEIVQIDGAQQALIPSLQNLGAHILYRQQRAYNGIAVFVDANKISELAALPGVKAIHPMTILHANAFSSVDFLSTRTFWNLVYSGGVGIHGENIKCAVIDTGLDYIHTNFGGPGTDAAYASVSDKSPVPNPYFPTAKVPGGFDFAGDLYTGGNTPAPDPNPLDSTNGHGTGCASIVGGFGTNFGGSTYVGNYDSATPIASMKISPGLAPQCKLYPVKISGPAGSSGILSQGYEWTLDPNGDGDFSDRMDVISCSFGGAAGPPDDATSISATNCAAAGIIVAQSAGNNGDSYYMVGEPSSANRTLSVAASYNDQAGFISNAAVIGNAPGSIAGQKGFAIYSSSSPRNVISGNVVRAVPPDASSALTNAAQVSGNIVLIDRGVNTFADKAAKAIAAGATGIIIANNDRTGIDPNNDPITQATGAETTVPDVMISKEDGDYIKGAAVFNPTTGVPLNATPVTIQPDNSIVTRANGPADTMPSYSVRGPRNNDSWLKPDITAPAEVVGIAADGVGQAPGGLRNQVGLFNGTSSAAPHVAGCLVLMKQLHPTWTVEEIMALAMNTSLHNLETTTARTVTYGVGRVGAGRIDNAFASAANGVAFNSTDLGMVSLSFGVVDVPADGAVHLVKNMTVRNKGTSPITYNLAYQENGPVVGDSYYGTTHATSFTVAAGASEVVPIQFNATGNTLPHKREGSVANAQATDFGTFARQWLTEKCGYAVLTPQGGGSEPTLRVPLYTCPRAVSSMHASITQVNPTADSGSFTIPLSGSGFAIAGTPTNTVSNGSTQSVVKVFELSYANPLANSPSAPNGDRFKVKYVGVTSDYVSYGGPSADHTPTTLTFAIDAFGNETTSDYYRGTTRYIYLDTDKNGTDDYRIYASELFASLPPAGQSSNNVYYSYSTNQVTGSGFAEYPINGFSSTSLDTNFYNNSLRTFSFDARDVGYTGGASSFNYHVVTFDDNGAKVDDTGTLTYDLARPGIDNHSGTFEPGNAFGDQPGSLTVNYNGANFQANQSKGVLLAHFHNGTGNRTDVVTLAKPTISGFSPSHAKVGANVIINGTGFNAATKVFFFNNKQATPVTFISVNTIEVKVPAGATTGPITVTGPGGSSTSASSFTVDP